MAPTHKSLFRGDVLTLTSGNTAAEITTVGATINRFVVDGRDFLLSSPLAAPAIGYRGALVAPWPNRLGDGVYTFEGETYEYPLNEHDRRTALHGYTGFANFTVEENTGSTALLSLEAPPSPGYPFPLRIEVEFSVSEGSIHTKVTATNLGEKNAPYGVCPHPYLVPGPEPLEEWTLTLPAQSVLEVNERLLPTSLVSLDSRPDLDLREGPIGNKATDHAFTDFSEGRIAVESESGSVWFEFDCEKLPWAQIYTCDNSDPSLHRKGVAVEPMTCPADAFRTGENLIVIAPNDSHIAEWTLGARVKK